MGMKIDIKDKINYNNFTTILSLFKSVKSLNLTGKDKKKLKKAIIEDIVLDEYCNMLRLSHFRQMKKFIIRNINLNGRYNVIELIDIPKGKFRISVNNKTDDYHVNEEEHEHEEEHEEEEDDEIAYRYARKVIENKKV